MSGRKDSGTDIAPAESSSKEGTGGSKNSSPTRPPPGFAAKHPEGTPATPPTGTKQGQ